MTIVLHPTITAIKPDEAMVVEAMVVAKAEAVKAGAAANKISVIAILNHN